MRARNLSRQRQSQPGTLYPLLSESCAIKLLKNLFPRSRATPVSRSMIELRRKISGSCKLLTSTVISFCPLEYFSAFDSKFTTTCAITSRSPLIIHRQIPAVVWTRNPVRFQVRTICLHYRFPDEANQIALLEIMFFSAPRSIREKSSTLLISRVSRDASAVMMFRYDCRFSRPQPRRPSASNSENIRIEVSGVFNSCDTLLPNAKSVFWRASGQAAGSSPPQSATRPRQSPPAAFAMSSPSVSSSVRARLRQFFRVEQIHRHLLQWGSASPTSQWPRWNMLQLAWRAGPRSQPRALAVSSSRATTMSPRSTGSSCSTTGRRLSLRHRAVTTPRQTPGSCPAVNDATAARWS